MGVRLVAAAALLVAAHAVPAAQQGTKSHAPIVLDAPKNLPAAVAAVERATGVKGLPLETPRGKVPPAEGRAFAVEPAVAERLLAGSHAPFRKAGVYLFRYERSYGLAGDKDGLALVATSDRNAVLRRMGTSGPKRGVTTEQIVTWLDALAKEEPFDLVEIGVDYVAGRFERSPKDPAAIARRSAELAPELVAGRASTLDLLVEEIHSNRTLYLIW
jgi:hypothetical protein